MNRRGFLGMLAAVPLAALVPKKEDEWIMYEDNIYDGQYWYGGSAGGGKSFALYEGIPYHQSNGTTGEWLGIKRA